MTEPETIVDAMLATACSRLLTAGAVANQMRELNRQAAQMDYWRAAVVLGEHLTVAGHALTEAHRVLLGAQGIVIQQDGGLVH
jgi:hypothetical protein